MSIVILEPQKKCLVFDKDKVERDDPILNMEISATISATMYFPREKRSNKKVYYEARCFLESMPSLVEIYREKTGANVDGVILGAVREKFITWENFTNIIFQDDSFDISNDFLDLTFKRGVVCGKMFFCVFHHGMTVAEAAEEVVQDVVEYGILNKWQATPENIQKNIWKKFKTIAHWWAALFEFYIKEREKTYIPIDKLIPKGHYFDIHKSGIAGFVEVAQYYYDYCIDNKLRHKRSKNMVLDPSNAWNVFIS